MPEETGQSPDREADPPASEEATRLSWLMWAPQPESRETDEKQENKVAAQPDVEVGAGAVGRPSRSWLWLAAAGVVLLLASGTGYLYFSGLLGKNPDKVQMKLNAELKAQRLNDVFVEIGKDWVATVSGFVDNEADKGRALGIVKTDKDVKDVEDRITLVTAEGSPAKTATEHPTAHAPEERAATAANIPVSTPGPLQQLTPAPAEKLSAGYSAETVRQYIQLGKAFHNEGDYDRAIEMFERVRRIDPGNVEAWRGTKQAEEAKVTETRVMRK